MHRALLLVAFGTFALPFVATAAPSSAPASTEPVRVGSIAPGLAVSRVQGADVPDLATLHGRVVVLDFWATWCGPCRTSIPHLTEMQKKFKDVIFIGVSNEEAGDVKPFVKKMGEKMDYTVAVDEDGKTSAGYMEAYGIDGIPHAFIVDKEGRIAWLGHPMGGLEQVLAEVVAGKFNLEKSRKRADAQKQVEEFETLAGRNPNDPKLAQLGKDLEALDVELDGITPGEKFNAAEVIKQVKFQGLMRDYQIATMSGKGGTNLDNIEKKLVEVAPKGFDMAEFKDSLAANKLLNDYMQAAQSGDAKSLPELSQKVAAVKTKNPRLLLQVAFTILSDERLKVHDYELAATLAKTAIEATGGKDAGALYVYGRALFESGKTAEAIAQIKNAIAAAGDNAEGRKELESTLKQYEEKLAKK